MIEFNEKDNNKKQITPEINTIELNDIYYNCIECPSLIEIKYINKKNGQIKFRCTNKHKESYKIMDNKIYLEKMKKYNTITINNDKCNKHKNHKYICYCFDCICHLCEECLKSRNHLNHNKINIVEIQPTKEELNKMKELIDNYNKEIKNIMQEKERNKKKLNNLLNNKNYVLNKEIKEKRKKILNKKKRRN